MTSHDETDLVRRRRERLGALLAATDPPLPPLAVPAARIARAARRRAAARWGAAAATVLFALAAVAVPPVRAWIVGTARALWSATAGTRAAPGSAAVATAGGGAGSVAFVPGAGPFTVSVARRQAGGTLTLEIVAGDSATAAVAEGGAAELIVLPRGLRIVNDAGARTDIVVRVPASVPAVELRVGDAAPRTFTPVVPGRRWVMDFAATP